MEYFYEDIPKSKSCTKAIRYYYQCKPEDEIAKRIYKEDLPLTPFMGVRIYYKNKTTLKPISKDEFDSKLIEHRYFISHYKKMT